jgi:hypothetical protein
MGCCLLAIIGALWPRLLLVLIYFFAPQIPAKAFHTVLYPLLGFFFLPATTLLYEVCITYIGPPDAAHPLVLLLLACALLSDLSQLGFFQRRRK